MDIYIKNVVLILVVGLWGFYLTVKSRFGLQMLQQNSYRTRRFIRWIKANLNRSFPIAEFATFVVCCFVAIIDFWIFLASLAILSFYLFWTFPQTKVKQPIVYTYRVKRLILTTIILWMLFLYATEIFFSVQPASLIYLPLGFLTAFPILIIANLINTPLERLFQHYYVNDAIKKMRSYDDLLIIGITGSYGKTTAKNIIDAILAKKYRTLKTPESYNTALGVTRTIREKLLPIHQAFVVEMGAKQKGDIAEICKIVKPQIAVISAIGPQHLETFKTLCNVQQTKFELVENLAKNGVAVLNWDDEYIKSYVIKNKCRIVKYGMITTDTLDYRAFDCVYDPQGLSFKVQMPNSEVIELKTKLLGRLNVYNMLAGVIVAIESGINKEQITLAVKKLEPVQHRLNLVKQAGDVTIIDDSYNSNPQGSAMALDILKNMPGHRILMTPGMIELGDQEYELNKNFGRKAAEVCDYVILVGRNRTKPIHQGLISGGFDETKIHIADNLFSGYAHLKTAAVPGSYVLIENDLPDSFNE